MMKNDIFSSSLLLDDSPLVCRAKVRLEIQVMDEMIPVDITISSRDILTHYREFMSLKPTPPRIPLVIKKDSNEGKELALEADELRLVPDYADPSYLKEKEEYSLDMMVYIVGTAVRLPNGVGDGLSPEGRCEKLIEKGLTLEQLAELFQKILKLGETKQLEIDSYIRQQTGVTTEILNKISKRARKNKMGGQVTSLYNKVNLLKEFDLEKLSEADQNAIAYAKLLENHFQAEQLEEQKKKQKQDEAMSRTAGKMPSVGRGGTFGGF